MNNITSQFLDTYGMTILYTILTAIAGYIGIAIKNLVTKYINDNTKKSVCKTVVKAVEQLYHDLGGADKLEKAKESVIEMLAQKNITITELELNMLIESVVAEFNYKFTEGE